MAAKRIFLLTVRAAAVGINLTAAVCLDTQRAQFLSHVVPLAESRLPHRCATKSTARAATCWPRASYRSR